MLRNCGRCGLAASDIQGSPQIKTILQFSPILQIVTNIIPLRSMAK
jgi:hypothetical protein